MAAASSLHDAETSELEIECGKGFYVRALARDLAAALGACGHVSALRRTAVGAFTEARAITLEFIEELCHRGAAWRPCFRSRPRWTTSRRWP